MKKLLKIVTLTTVMTFSFGIFAFASEGQTKSSLEALSTKVRVELAAKKDPEQEKQKIEAKAQEKMEKIEQKNAREEAKIDQKAAEKKVKVEEKAAKEKAKIIEKTAEELRKLEERIKVKGKNIKFDVPPVIKEGRTLIPVRAVTQGLGAQVSYDAETKQVTITKGELTVVMTLGSVTLDVNGEAKELDVPAESFNNRTFVPLRFLAEIFGEKVNYDEETGDIDIGDSDEDEEDVDENDEDGEEEDATETTVNVETNN